MARSRSELNRQKTLENAWIGDAVLSLFARLRILEERKGTDGEKFIRMTSNRFLAILGEPSEMEAAVGGIFQREGLEAAFAWVEQKLMPTFERQETNRLKRGLKK